MDAKVFKTGSTAIVIGSNYYSGYMGIHPNMLVKVLKRDERHDEFKYLEIVRSVENYTKYYSIPENICYLVKPNQRFYNYLKDITQEYRMTIFQGDIECYYINYAGDKDLQETIADMLDGVNNKTWRKYSDIIKMAKKILTALSYLHDKKICHLDVKSENIVMNTKTREFKLIDFGFASMEPFDDYVFKPNGTPGYFPKQFDFDKPTAWFPKIEALDGNMIYGHYQMVSNRNLVYKIDSYCFGRTLYFLRYIFEDKIPLSCFDTCTTKDAAKLDKIISLLLENDPKKRILPKECLETCF